MTAPALPRLDVPGGLADARRTVDTALAAGPQRTRRTLLVLLGVLAVAVIANITIGDYPLALDQVVPTLLGDGDPGAVFILRDVRLPRIIVGLLVGAGLGLSGGIFQSVARNPLASPDILGVTAGASAAAVFLITTRSLNIYEVDPQGGITMLLPLAAIAGALVTALLMYRLAYKGGLSSYRLVLIGIAVGETFFAMTAFMLARADLKDAAYGSLWLTGSLNAHGWDTVVPLAVAMAVLVPAALAMSRPLGLLRLGDDVAKGVGSRVEPAKAALVTVGVLLVGVAVAAAGPVAFVAFVAGPIARRLSGTGGPALAAAGLVGAALVLTADLAGRVVLSSTEIPVGIVTALVGVPYLLWLLARTNRVGLAG